MSKQGKERGKTEGAKGESHAGLAPKPARDDSQSGSSWAKRLRVQYGLWKTGKLQVSELHAMDPAKDSSSDGDIRSALYTLCMARVKLFSLQHNHAERLRACEEIAPRLTSKARAATAAKPYSMGTIKLYAECLDCMLHAPAAVSAFLQEWFEGPLGNFNIDEWVDPVEEATDDDIQGTSKKEHLAPRRQELDHMWRQAVRKLDRTRYFEKAAIGISKDLMVIAERGQLEEADRQEGDARLLDQQQQERLEREAVQKFVEAKLKDLPVGSKARIDALLALTDATTAQLTDVVAETLKTQLVLDKEDKGKDKGKVKGADAFVADAQGKLLRSLQQARERGTWTQWSATLPSQLRGDEEVEDAGAGDDGGDKAGKAPAGKAGKGKGGKGTAAGGGKGAGKGADSGKQAQGDSGEADDAARRPQDVYAWLKLLDQDIESQTPTTNQWLPHDGAPSIPELWNNAVPLLESDGPLGDVEAAVERGEDPVSILMQYCQEHDESAASLFPGVFAKLDCADPLLIAQDIKEDATQELRQWYRKKDLAAGFGVLLNTRGLCAVYESQAVCQGTDNLWADFHVTMEQFRGYWQHEDHQLPVQAIEGDALPEDMFAMAGSSGLIPATGDIPSSIQKLSKRRSEALQQESMGPDALQGLEAMPEPRAKALVTQVRMDLVDAVRLLREAKLLLPMLKRAVARYLAACAKQHGREVGVGEQVLADDKNLMQALTDLTYVQLKPLRVFLLTELGRRQLSLLPNLKCYARDIADLHNALSPDLKATSSRGGGVPLRMSRDTLELCVRGAANDRYFDSVRQSLDEFQEVCADSCVLPVARWPAMPKAPELGTPEAEQLLVEYLWLVSTGPPVPTFRFDYVLHFISMAAFACAKARQMQQEGAKVAEELDQGLADGSVQSSPDMLVKLRRRISQLLKETYEAWGSLYKVRGDDARAEVQALEARQQELTNKLSDATKSRQKVKEGAAGKKGGQAPAEKRDESLVNALEEEKGHVTDELDVFKAMEGACNTGAQTMARYVREMEQQERRLDSFSDPSSLAQACQEDIDKVAWCARKSAMLSEVCLANAHHIAAQMACSPPYYSGNQHTSLFANLWRNVLVDGNKVEISMDLITEEETAKAKAKEEKKKKEANKAAAKKGSKQQAVTKAASDDEEEEQKKEAAPAKPEPAAEKEMKIRVDGQELQEEEAGSEEPAPDLASAQQQEQQAAGRQEEEGDEQLQLRITQDLMREYNVSEEAIWDDERLTSLLLERCDAHRRAQERRLQDQQRQQQQQQQQREASIRGRQQQQQQPPPPPPQQQSGRPGAGPAGRQPLGNGAAEVDASRDASGGPGPQGRRPRDRDAPLDREVRDVKEVKESKDHVFARVVGGKLVPYGSVPEPGAPVSRAPAGGVGAGAGAGSGGGGGASVRAGAGGTQVPGMGSDDESSVHPSRQKKGKKKGGRGGEAPPPVPGQTPGGPPGAGPRQAVPGMEYEEEQHAAKGKGKGRRGAKGRQGGEADSAMRQQDQRGGGYGGDGGVWQSGADGNGGWVGEQREASPVVAAMSAYAHWGGDQDSGYGAGVVELGPPALPEEHDDEDIQPPTKEADRQGLQPSAGPGGYGPAGYGPGGYGPGGYEGAAHGAGYGAPPTHLQPPQDHLQQQQQQQQQMGGEGWQRQQQQQQQSRGDGWHQQQQAGGDSWQQQHGNGEGWQQQQGPGIRAGEPHGEHGMGYDGMDPHGKLAEARHTTFRPLPTVPDPNLAQFGAFLGSASAPPPHQQGPGPIGGPFFAGPAGPAPPYRDPTAGPGHDANGPQEAGLRPGPGAGYRDYPDAQYGRRPGDDGSAYPPASQSGFSEQGLGGRGFYPGEQGPAPAQGSTGQVDQQQQQQRQQGPPAMQMQQPQGLPGFPPVQPLHAPLGPGPGPNPPGPTPFPLPGPPPGVRPPLQLPPHLQGLPATNPQILPVQIRPPIVAGALPAGVRLPPPFAPQFPGGLQAQALPAGGMLPMGPSGPGGLPFPAPGGAPAMGPGMPGLQQQQQQQQQQLQQDSSGVEGGEGSGDDDADDLMALCGVAAPPRPVPGPVAGAALAPPGLGVSPPMVSSMPMGPGPVQVGVPAGMPWQVPGAPQLPPPQQVQVQPATSTGSAASATTAPPTPWNARHNVMDPHSMALMNDPGPAGFVGVIDDQEYPTLAGPGPDTRKGTGVVKSSWASVAKTQVQAHLRPDDEEEKALQQALDESRRAAEQANSASYAGSRSVAGAGAGPGVAQDSASSQLSGVAATGLVNRQGEYNCFLNVIIQCLWHCDAFRRIIEQHAPERFQGQPVVHSLALLFRALSEAERSFSTGGHRTTVDPTQLREALDTLPNHNFRLGEMNDPSEVLTAIYECLTKSPQLRTPKNASEVDYVFGLQLSEQLNCHACGKVSHVIKPHVEYFHIVQATALRNMAIAASGTMATLLQELESQNQKKCDRDLQGCDLPGTPCRKLMNQPQMFTLLVAWEEQVTGEEVRQTLEAVDTELVLREMYDECRAVHPYRLHSMFCYYGQHYHAFIHKEELQQWVMFDDAHVASIGGSWQDVVNKCTAGRIQPLVLFYKMVQ